MIFIVLFFRLGFCEVCAKNSAIYCCPECEVKTCSLPCVNIHKKELECNGIRNRVKFKPLTTFTNMDLQNGRYEITKLLYCFWENVI